jgi:hypothetical protein
MHYSGEDIHEYLRYVEINGHKSSYLLREELDKYFNEFKLNFAFCETSKLTGICTEQIDGALMRLNHYMQNDAAILNDIDFTDMVMTKLLYCKRTIELLNTNSKKNTVIKPRFKIRKEASKRSHDILTYIHREFKREGYIDCKLPDFKKVFTSDNPAPITWLKPYSHLSYFIKELSSEFIEDSRNPSKYELGLMYFHNHETGKPFEVKKKRCDKFSNKSDKKFIDITINSSVGYHLMHS